MDACAVQSTRLRIFLLSVLLLICHFAFAENLKIPDEFADRKWYSIAEKDCLPSGELNLEGSGWSLSPYGRLVFSKEHYAFGDPWSGIGSAGKYSVVGNKVKFDPPIAMHRWDEPYRVSELSITTTDREPNSGSQVLVDSEDTISFLGWKYPNASKFVVINGVKSTPQNIPVLITENHRLYALPKQSSKNLLGAKNYYGGLVTKAFVSVDAVPVDADSPWLHVSIDFTADEPIDGGGPFYSGWVEKSKVVYIIGSRILTVSDKLRLRMNPDTKPETKIVKTLSKFTEAKVLAIQPYKARIDDIWDHWYQVALDGGESGWIFGGYAQLFQNESDKDKLIAKYKNVR